MANNNNNNKVIVINFLILFFSLHIQINYKVVYILRNNREDNCIKKLSINKKLEKYLTKKIIKNELQLLNRCSIFTKGTTI